MVISQLSFTKYDWHHNVEKEVLEKRCRELMFALDQSSIVAFTDLKGNITHVNDKFCEVSKYSRDELIGRNHRIINSGFHSKDFMKELWTTIQSGKIWRGEIKNKAKDGSFYWVFTTIIPTLNTFNKPYQYISIRYDITEMKKAKEAKDLFEKQLSILKSNQEMSDRFVSALTHDMRTPLTVAKLSLQMMERSVQSPELLIKHINRIMSNVERIESMVVDLLNATKIRAGQIIHLDKNECNLEKVVKKSVDELNNIYNSRINFISSGDSNGIWSGLGIQRVVENLCINAFKYGDKYAPVLVNLIGNENEIILSVHNDGECIPEEELPELFDYLARTSSASSGNQVGWGIGLTLVKGMVESHGGQIQVLSQPHLGTTFIIHLPKILLN